SAISAMLTFTWYGPSSAYVCPPDTANPAPLALTMPVELPSPQLMVAEKSADVARGSPAVKLATVPTKGWPSMAEKFAPEAVIGVREMARSTQKLQPPKVVNGVVVCSQKPPESANLNT